MDVKPLRSFSHAALRTLGIAAGVATHLLFVYTVWRLFLFLYDCRSGHGEGSLWIDVGLALFFAVPHSLLLWPPVRKRLGAWIAAPFYGLFYAVVTCVSLLVVFEFWQKSDFVAWQLNGSASLAMTAGFFASWIALLYSLHLTGLGFQTGLTPWLAWVRRQPAAAGVPPAGRLPGDASPGVPQFPGAHLVHAEHVAGPRGADGYLDRLPADWELVEGPTLGVLPGRAVPQVRARGRGLPADALWPAGPPSPRPPGRSWASDAPATHRLMARFLPLLEGAPR